LTAPEQVSGADLQQVAGADLQQVSGADLQQVAGAATAAVTARSVQVAIRAQLLLDVAKLWPALDPKRLGETWPGWIRAMSLLTRSYHTQSSTAAGASYRLAREHATRSPAPMSLVKLAPAPDETWMRKAYGYSAPGMLNKDTARPGTALSTTLGTAARIVMDGGRTTVLDTVAADPVATGWYFETDGDPCWWCAMIASRGFVFKEHSFDISDARFLGAETKDSAKVHNNCGCVIVGVFSKSHQLPDINQEARQIYYDSTGDVTGADKLVAFRKAWNARNNPDAATTPKGDAAKPSVPKVGKTGRTSSEIQAEIDGLKKNLATLTSPTQVAYHQQRIAKLTALLG
jgi:hypothetical protein